MSSFTSALTATLLRDGMSWELAKVFTYHVGSEFSRKWIKVAKGFITDFASIPKFIFWLLPWWAKFNKSSLLHDWLYFVKFVMGKPITRKQADDIWLEAMLVEFREHKSGKFVAYAEYYPVRLFGWMAWH